ncbi:MAG TPA: AsmA-like C-terminal region-containing protein [Paludibacter sp.]
MKKNLKRVLILFSSLIFLLLLAIGIALWFVFTPEKLTPIVRTQAAKYITCKTEIGDVELTFFSTFPRFGLKVNHFALINPVPNAPATTLVQAEQFVGIVDMAAWWKRDELVLTELLLSNGTINAFTDSLGHTNFDIIRSDTIISQADTAQSALPFKFINIENVVLANVNISYIDQSQKLQANVNKLTAQFSGSLISDTVNATMHVIEGTVSVNYQGESYLQNASVSLNTLAKIILSKQSVTFSEAEAAVNKLNFKFSGSVENDTLHQQIITDLKYQFKAWSVPEILALIPPSYRSYIEGVVSSEGTLSSEGKIKGVYTDSLMPLMDLHLVLQDGALKYDALSVPLSHINGDVVFYSDLNNDALSYLRIDEFTAQTPKSRIKTNGMVTHLLTDIECDLNSDAKLVFSEFAPMIPPRMKLNLTGTVSGKVKSLFTQSQVEKMQLDKMKLSGSVQLWNFDAKYDSLSFTTDYSKVDFALPNPKISSKNTRFAAVKIKSKRLETRKLKGYNALLTNALISLETSDVMDTTSVPNIVCSFKLDSVAAAMDTIYFAAQKPAGQFSMLPQKGKEKEPRIKLDFNCGDLATSMGTSRLNTNHVRLNADVLNNKVQPKIKLEYSSQDLKMKMGSNAAQMNKIELNADIVNDQQQKDIFLQWLVKGFVNIDKGVINLSSLNYPLEIPSIQMNFDPEVFNIKESKLKIDNSDFSLEGTFSNVLSYFRKDSLLRGKFDFVSNHTDVMQLMNLTSGIGSEASDSVDAVGGPYMVPKGMDLQMNVNIAAATFGVDSAKVINGAVRVKDGLLVLDNFDFTTPAARMQITTMYRTPRKNHLFMGLDVRMQRVEIEELLKMIPDIDSIMPMLKSFRGKGEFHMAVETYLDSLYNPKKSTIRGAASIKGQDLVLMDGPTFSEIAKTLRFNKKTNNKVDSLSAEFTVFKQEIDVYPFLIVMDKYKAVIAGRHNMDLSFNYHISVVDSPLPFKFGINVTGTIDDMKYHLAKCKYAEFYRPAARFEVQNRQLELRKMIHDALNTKVKPE